MDIDDEEAEPAADEQGPSQVAIVIAVVAVIAVLGFGALLLTRGDDDDLASAPATTGSEPEPTGGITTPSAPTTTTTTGSPPTVTLPPTTDSLVPPSSLTPPPSTSPTGPPSTGGPPAVLPPPSGLPTVVPPTVVPPPFVPSASGPPAILPPPSSPSVLPPPSSAALVPPPSVPESTDAAPPSSAPTSTASPPPPSAPPASSEDLADLVPNVAGEAAFVTDGGPRRALIDALLESARHDVASPTPVSTVCAAVALDDRGRIGGRWEVDSRPLGSIDPRDVGPPGFGDCVDADGDPLADGAYQFVAVDATGAMSAAGTFVIGAGRIDQQFRNDSGQDVCAVLIGPATASYYESYRLGDAAVEPGEALTIPLADVRQDVRTIGCDDQELAEFSFDPSGEVQDLVP